MAKITEIRLKDYRCFHNEQTAILKPLTLLVGENSTGKTSLMAMVRALYDASFYHIIPDFKESPYDLGSFDDIAHKRGSKGGKANEFSAGFDAIIDDEDEEEEVTSNLYKFDVTFAKQGATPVPKIQNHNYKNVSVEERFSAGRVEKIIGRTSNGAWEMQVPYRIVRSVGTRQQFPPLLLYLETPSLEGKPEYSDYKPLPGNPDMKEEDYIQIQRLGLAIFYHQSRPPNASAPVRSKPQRTYNPSPYEPDSEGNYVPMYFADLHTQDKDGWKELKSALEGFGKSAGLFDQILIKQFGNEESEPFQVRVRKFDRKTRGPFHNIIDVGYGVSQILPIITELWSKNRDGSSLFLLQQPEVHLHPKAQAALGTLFTSLASSGNQLIVETHSDHLVDRVRMEVRDGTTLLPEDVSILFFERVGLDVVIRSLGFDKQGNVIGAPPSYRKFFLEEMKRSVGLI